MRNQLFFFFRLTSGERGASKPEAFLPFCFLSKTEERKSGFGVGLSGMFGSRNSRFVSALSRTIPVYILSHSFIGNPILPSPDRIENESRRAAGRAGKTYFYRATSSSCPFAIHRPALDDPSGSFSDLFVVVGRRKEIRKKKEKKRDE